MALIALSASSQTSGQYTTQTSAWEPLNSYIAGGLVTGVAMILKSRYGNIEIIPEIGPSSNWMRYDQELASFYRSNNVTPGKLWGFSGGYLMGFRFGYDSKYLARSGVSFDSKGRSYKSEYAEGYSRLNYISIPMMIGIESDRDRDIITSVCLGAFLAFPVGEKHAIETNGIKSETKPMQTIGPDAGLLTNLGIEYKINSDISFNTDIRIMSGMAQTEKLAGKGFTQSAQILFGIKIFTSSYDGSIW